MTTAKLQNLNTQNLASSLLLSLDESYFFNTLANHFKAEFNCDQVAVYKFSQDGASTLVSLNGEAPIKSENFDKSQGAPGYIFRTKRGYFSNSVERDPVFHLEAKMGVKAELCFPIISEGLILGSVHCRMMNNSREFTREDITQSVSVLNELKHSVQNMKMYMQAKALNEMLLKTIELKEKELQDSRFGVKTSEAYKINEKDIIGRSASMKELLALVDKIADKDLTAFIQGEAGTGKEMIARRIHCRSSRRDRAFIAIDCSIYNEKQLDLELFGDSRVVGAFENAHFGTLFLNNVEGISPYIQNKIMQMIQHKTGVKSDSRDFFKSDVRVISASSKDVLEMVKNGQFKDELYYALSSVLLKAPSLKERKEDIELLANFFLNIKKNKEDQKSFSPSAIKSMTEYAWPGNVRELQNVVERAAVLSEGMIIEKQHLDEHINAASNIEVVVAQAPKKQVAFVQVTLEELEKNHIMATLENLGGNKTKTAKVLGITVKTLYNKLHSYGIAFDKDA